MRGLLAGERSYPATQRVLDLRRGGLVVAFHYGVYTLVFR